MKTIKEFLTDIESGELKEEYIKLATDNMGKPVEERSDLIIAFAKEKGYEITPEDLALADADKKKLDDRELNRMAAGGLAGNVGHSDDNCVFDYRCYATWNTCDVSEECAMNLSCEGNLA